MFKKRLIYVLAPANPMADLSESSIQIGIQQLKRIGFDVIFGRNSLIRGLYTAGTREERQ